jgi:hypothetical protein
MDLMRSSLLGLLTPFLSLTQYQQKEQRDWTVQQCYDITRLTGWQSARQIADGCESAWVKMSHAGRGAPYSRSPDIRIERTQMIYTQEPRRIDRRILEETAKTRQDESPQGSNSNKKLVLAHAEKAYYALGLLGVEQDLERLDLDAAER